MRKAISGSMPYRYTCTIVNPACSATAHCLASADTNIPALRASALPMCIVITKAEESKKTRISLCSHALQE